MAYKLHELAKPFGPQASPEAVQRPVGLSPERQEKLYEIISRINAAQIEDGYLRNQDPELPFNQPVV